MTLQPSPEFGIYLHWPYCQSLCPYCDFNTYAAKQIDYDAWTKAYLRQLDHSSEEIGGRDCQSVYFGGGTPSLMPPSMVGDILTRIDRHWTLSDQAEVTLEANPSSSDTQKFSDYRAAGINRLSIGVQSLRNDGLKTLGRQHTSTEAKSAFEIANRHFKRINIDLMFGRPNQSLKTWEKELEDVTLWGAGHLSLYQLTIESKTAFGLRHAAGKLPGLPTEGAAAEMHEVAEEICQSAGYRRYEVSNYAYRGHESRHNLLYWRSQDFLGVGPGAHGRLTITGQRVATETHLAPSTWLNKVGEKGSGESRRVLLSQKEQADEYLMMSLRLKEGTDLKRLMDLSVAPLNQERLNQWQTHGLIKIDHDRLFTTTRGSLLLNTLVRDLMDTDPQSF